MGKRIQRATTLREGLFLGLFCLTASIAVAIAAHVLADEANPPVAIDLSFSDSTQQPGRILTDFRPLGTGERSSDLIHAIAIQPDGKIVVAGETRSPNGDRNFALVRYHPIPTPPPGSSTPESIDLTFSDSTQQPGRIITDLGDDSTDSIQAIAIQADGKIVAAGYSDAPNGSFNFALVRYHPQPTPPPGSSIPVSIDLTFGDNPQLPGRVLTDFRQLEDRTRSHDEAQAIAIQPDGKIIAAGYSNSPNGDQNFALVRYNTNGTIDLTFSDSTQQPGRVLTDFRAISPGRRSNDYIRAIALQADGKIVAAGESNSPNGDANFALVRYHPNGVIDTSFGDNTQQPGRVLTDFRFSSSEDIHAIAIQADGKIVAAGRTNAPNGDQNFALARYSADGILDTTFGDRGRVITDIRFGQDIGSAVAIQPDGKIIAAGRSSAPNGDDNFALVRYLPNGAIDRTFGDSTVQPGTILTDFRPYLDPSSQVNRRSEDWIQAIAIQADGKSIAAGWSQSPNGDPNFALIRYHR